MGATTKGLPWPPPTDPVAQGAAAIRALAEAADTAFAVVKLADTKLAAAAANITFASIPQIYTHLRLVVNARDVNAGTGYSALNVFLNGDVGANYDLQLILATAAVVSAGESIGVSSLTGGDVTQGGCPANIFSGNVYDFLDYRSPYNKVVKLEVMGRKSVTAGGADYRTGSGFWHGLIPITQISMSSTGGNLAVGTRATLYGIS